MTVRWSVKIEESTDGKSWVGFTSRGAGCSNDVVRRSTAGGNSEDSILANVRRVYNEPSSEIDFIDEELYKHPTNGFMQVFYGYTRPDSFPVATRPQPVVTQTGSDGPAATSVVYSDEFEFQPNVLNRIYGFYRGKFEVGLPVKLDVFEISYDATNKKVKTSMTVATDPTSEWFNFVFVSGRLGDNASRDRVMSANKEYDPKVLRSGTLTLPDGRYGWSIVGLRKKN